MKLNFYTFMMLGLCSLAISCKTASKLYQKGNYDEAVELAAKKLQKDPNDAKLTGIIQNAYQYAVYDHENRIRTDNESLNDLKWEWIYSEYASLQKMYDAIYRVPAVYTLIHPADYSSYLVTYGEKAGDARFNRGMAFMQQKDKQSYQNAYREFQAASRFLPGDPEVMDKINEAYENAVTNIIVLPMQQNGGFVYSSYSVGTENLDDQLIRNLQYNSGNEFVKFYSAWDARSRQIRTDKFLQLQFISFNPGNYYDQISRRKVTREVVVKETVYKPDSVVKKYATVHADIITTKRVLESNALLQISLSDENGNWIWHENIPASYSWNTAFVTYKGDERALSNADKQEIDRKRVIPPSENEVVKCMLEEIQSNTLARIRTYFNRY